MMTSRKTFPEILHNMLENEPSTVVTWTGKGTAFGIVDKAAFERDVLTSYFKHNKFSNFHRRLNLYGFRKIVKGRESGCFMHPCFLRDRPDRLSEVRRGVVPPCPESYITKVYGSGPRFMNQDDGSDSEPELITPPTLREAATVDNSGRVDFSWRPHDGGLQNEDTKAAADSGNGLKYPRMPTSPVLGPLPGGAFPPVWFSPFGNFGKNTTEGSSCYDKEEASGTLPRFFDFERTNEEEDSDTPCVITLPSTFRLERTNFVVTAPSAGQVLSVESVVEALRSSLAEANVDVVDFKPSHCVLECSFHRGNRFVSMNVRVFKAPDYASGQLLDTSNANLSVDEDEQIPFVVEAQLREGDKLHFSALFREIMREFMNHGGVNVAGTFHYLPRPHPAMGEGLALPEVSMTPSRTITHLLAARMETSRSGGTGLGVFPPPVPARMPKAQYSSELDVDMMDDVTTAITGTRADAELLEPLSLAGAFKAANSAVSHRGLVESLVVLSIGIDVGGRVIALTAKKKFVLGLAECQAARSTSQSRRRRRSLGGLPAGCRALPPMCAVLALSLATGAAAKTTGGKTDGGELADMVTAEMNDGDCSGWGPWYIWVVNLVLGGFVTWVMTCTGHHFLPWLVRCCAPCLQVVKTPETPPATGVDEELGPDAPLDPGATRSAEGRAVRTVVREETRRTTTTFAYPS